MKKPTVVVLGAAGAQASGLFEGFVRTETELMLLLCDRVWLEAEAPKIGTHEVRRVLFDLRTDPLKLRQVLTGADLVVNLVGSDHTLDALVHDAARAAGIDPRDICDEADVADFAVVAQWDQRPDRQLGTETGSSR